MKHQHLSLGSLTVAFRSLGVSRWAYGLVILGASATIAADDEPSYKGRLLSEWLGDMVAGRIWDGASPTEKAVQAMGTNAIPTLLEWMSYEPSPAEMRREAGENVAPWRPVTNLNRYPGQRCERAGDAFCYLGAVARSTIPELTRFARTASDLQRAERFAFALASVGPEAVPHLLSLATNSPPWTRYSAIEALVHFAGKPLAPSLVPVLMNCLSQNETDTEYPVSGPAERVLLAMDPKVVVPALTNALQSASAYTRQRAINCLWDFESMSMGMDSTTIPPVEVPAIRAAMRDPDSQVRSVAVRILREMGGWERVGEGWVRPHGTNTLNGITPDFFTNAPPR